jgi:chromosome segregation ATPase
MSLALDTELDQAGARLCQRIEDQEQQLAQVTGERDKLIGDIAFLEKRPLSSGEKWAARLSEDNIALQQQLAERDAELARVDRELSEARQLASANNMKGDVL